jgi:hypothetical protein
LKLQDGSRGIEDKSAVIAGMMGYKFHHETTATRPAVEPMHGSFAGTKLYFQGKFV